MVTEYEQLLGDMLNERRAKLEDLKTKKGKKSQIETLTSEIAFVEAELGRYQGGLTLFRSKQLPKVGRWGRPEASSNPAADNTS
ncbi:MAG: hypothetical protein OK455_05900 [Thaumarchaeota archaeon]|nr:hypothetical protein [Nitrososphaerota archaeon]